MSIGTTLGLKNLNNLAGGLASSAVSFAFTGNATFNILNLTDFGTRINGGLLELTVGKDGISSKIGNGGTNISYSTIKSSISGASSLHKNSQINKTGYDKTTLDALRSQYGFGDKTAKKQLDSIINGDTILKLDADGSEVAQSINENGQKIIHINSSQNEGFIDLGLTLQHEAYRDGIVSDAQSQFIETANAVAGHTQMALAMANDKLYTKDMLNHISSDTNLQNDINAYIYASYTGNTGLFADYVNAAYDSSADYWRVLSNGDLYDDGLDDRVSFEDGRDTIYYGKKSKQGTLEKFLGLESGTGYMYLLKDSGYSYTDGKWELDKTNNPHKIISYEKISNLINEKLVSNSYQTQLNIFEKSAVYIQNELKTKLGSSTERNKLKEKQAAAIANPNYQQGSQGPFGFLEATSETTWCNMATQDITFETSYNLSMALRNENDPYCLNTNANAMYDNLMKAAQNPNSSIVEVTPQQAQALANLGYTVAGTWQSTNPEVSGHIATVEAGHEYNSETGPYFGNEGDSRYTGTGQKAIEAFGEKNYQSIKYYYDKNQFKNRRWY